MLRTTFAINHLLPGIQNQLENVPIVTVISMSCSVRVIDNTIDRKLYQPQKNPKVKGC